jgi:hypothetical protein
LAVHLLGMTMSLAGLGACNLNLSTDVEAKDQWTRTYPLTADGTLILAMTNGEITVTGGDTDRITVTAERTVRARTEEAAKEQLATFEMKEEVSPSRVSIDSTSRGIQINVSRHIKYVVTLPRTAALSLNVTNGEIRVSGIGGHFIAEASNGEITATALQKSAQVSTSNGEIDLSFDHVAAGADGIRAETTNGTIMVTIPTTTNASVSARVVNGAISHEGLDLKIAESSRRRVDGTLGTGGPQIRLETTNGAISISGRDPAK